MELTVPNRLLNHHHPSVLSLSLHQVLLASNDLNGFDKLVRNNRNTEEEPDEEEGPHNSQQPIGEQIDSEIAACMQEL